MLSDPQAAKMYICSSAICKQQFSDLLIIYKAEQAEMHK